MAMLWMVTQIVSHAQMDALNVSTTGMIGRSNAVTSLAMTAMERPTKIAGTVSWAIIEMKLVTAKSAPNFASDVTQWKPQVLE